MRWGRYGNEAAATASAVLILIIDVYCTRVRARCQNYSHRGLQYAGRNPSYISSQESKETPFKTYNRTESSLILLRNCNSSNPSGEKCKTTTEKGAASKQ